MTRALPRYLDGAIAAYRAGLTGRDVHLGFWDDPPDLATVCDLAEFTAAQAALTRRVLALDPAMPGQRVLDVACGLGGVAAGLVTRDGAHVTALNIDARQLACCRGLGASLVAADASALPFPAGCFDRALCVEAMFHFTSRAVFLAEVARVLRRGGALTVTDILIRAPETAPWPGPVMEAALRLDYGPWPDIWTEWRDWQRVAMAAGLRVDRWEDWTAQTLPSYRITAPSGAIYPRPTAGAVMRWLHAAGYLSYVAVTLRTG